MAVVIPALVFFGRLFFSLPLSHVNEIFSVWVIVSSNSLALCSISFYHHSTTCTGSTYHVHYQNAHTHTHICKRNTFHETVTNELLPNEIKKMQTKRQNEVLRARKCLLKKNQICQTGNITAIANERSFRIQIFFWSSNNPLNDSRLRFSKRSAEISAKVFLSQWKKNVHIIFVLRLSNDEQDKSKI